MSREYINKSDLVWVKENRLRGFRFEDDSEWFFPPLTTEDKFEFNENIYSGFLVDAPSATCLDYQYIYNPKRFLNIQGGAWKVFRKNIKKYVQRNPGNIEYVQIGENVWVNEIRYLFLNWAEGRKLFDNVVMAQYMFEGKHRWGLLHNKKLIGMNAFDENYKFINFRYSVDDGSPFLNEFLRYCFYTHRLILNKEKLVNDGGSLDSENLAKFKLKLNPVSVYKVCSYKKEF